MSALTGRTRYRRGWFGRLILQVEFSQRYVRDLNGSGYYDSGLITKWRDARVDDYLPEPTQVDAVSA